MTAYLEGNWLLLFAFARQKINVPYEHEVHNYLCRYYYLQPNNNKLHGHVCHSVDCKIFDSFDQGNYHVMIYSYLLPIIRYILNWIIGTDRITSPI